MKTGFFQRHPLLRDALVWAIPALLFGAALRLLFLSYAPYAYWGSDSRSFMGFADGVLNDFYFSINEKRRYLYPVFLLPLSVLPGGTLRWLNWTQALLGLATILPMAYLVRRTFAHWRWFIIPVTVVLAGMPVFIWYEHEMIADSVVFNCLIWAMAGWAAWVSQSDKVRARKFWWWFLVPFAILLLTKPSGKFLWPGVALALVIVFAWRVLRWPQWLSLVLLFFASLTAGDEEQSAWLFYTTAFPLTRLDTPAHAEYKAEIRDWVQRKRDRIDFYDEVDDEVHDFLRDPENYPAYPLWQALARDKKKQNALFKSLALEGILGAPHLYLHIGLQRLVGSCNQADFKPTRLYADYYAGRFKEMYPRREKDQAMLRIVFGLPRSLPFPTYEQFRPMVSPSPDSAAARFFVSYAEAYQAAGALVTRPQGDLTPLRDCRPTFLVWWLLAGALLSLQSPYRCTLGVWTIALCGYLPAVFLVGIEHHRYFALAWPLIILLLALVPQVIISLFPRRKASLV